MQKPGPMAGIEDNVDVLNIHGDVGASRRPKESAHFDHDGRSSAKGKRTERRLRTSRNTAKTCSEGSSSRQRFADRETFRRNEDIPRFSPSRPDGLPTRRVARLIWLKVQAEVTLVNPTECSKTLPMGLTISWTDAARQVRLMAAIKPFTSLESRNS